jgi:hypothetical protein
LGLAFLHQHMVEQKHDAVLYFINNPGWGLEVAQEGVQR